MFVDIAKRYLIVINLISRFDVIVMINVIEWQSLLV